MDELTQIGLKNKTDKAYYHHFTEIYYRFFEPIKNKNLNILEIGVADGGSLLTLKEYFKNSSLFFIDINDKSHFIDDRVSFEQGDQSNYTFISNIFNNINFDIIIDDGGHTMVQQQVTLEALLPRLKPNGLFIIEDLHTSNFKEFNATNIATTLNLLENILTIDPNNVHQYCIQDITKLQSYIKTCEIYYTNDGKSITSVITRV